MNIETKDQSRVLEIRDDQTFLVSNPTFLDWDDEEKDAYNSKLLRKLRQLGLPCSDKFDALDFLRSTKGARWTGGLFEKYFAKPERIESLVVQALTRIQTSSVSRNKGGRPPNKTRYSKHEHDAMREYCKGKTLEEIDYDMSKRKGAKRGVGENQKDWKDGDAGRTINAAKKRKAIVRDGVHYKIVATDVVGDASK